MQCCVQASLRSRHLEVVGTRRTGGQVSPSCAPILSCIHYIQAPAKQAMFKQPFGAAAILQISFITQLVLRKSSEWPFFSQEKLLILEKQVIENMKIKGKYSR